MGRMSEAFARRYYSEELGANTFNRIFVWDEYYNRLYNLVANQFKWKGLPYGCTNSYVERTLIETGQLALVEHPDLGLIICPCTAEGINHYQEPVRVVCQPLNASTFTVDYDNCVILYNSTDKLGEKSTLAYFCDKLTHIDRIFDVNIQQFTNPFVVFTDADSKKTFENVIEKVKLGFPYIFVKKDFKMKTENLFDLKPQDHTRSLLDAKDKYMNEFYTRYGINNSAIMKRERLVADEVNSNNEIVSLGLANRMIPRETFCKQAKEKFGIDISFELTTNLIDSDNLNEKVGEENE